MEAGTLYYTALIFLSGLYLWKALVRRYWSNLPPSPWPLPLIGHMHVLGKGIPRQRLQALSSIYGPIFHLQMGATPYIVITSPTLAREVLKHHDHALSSRPYTLSGEHISYDFQGMVFTPDNEHWKEMRKLCMTELFSSRRIESFRGVRMTELQHMMSAVLRHGQKPVQLRKLVTAFNFNSMTQITINKKFYTSDGTEINGPAKEFLEVSNEAVHQILQLHISEFVPSYLRWIDWTTPQLRKLHAKQDQFLSRILEERKSENHGSTQKLHDFMDIILEHTKDFPNGDDIVKAMILEMLVGATETIVTTIEWTFAELLKNPHILEKAKEELTRVVGAKRLIEESEFTELSYLQAVLKEVFRLHPPLGLLVPHAAVEDCKLAGYTIPKGATVIVNAYAIARDPLLWDDPEEFKPERFLGNRIDVKGQDFELLPFGSGRRICPGMVLGLRTVHLVLSNLLHSFDWSHVPGNSYVLEEADGIVAWLKTPLELVATPRFPEEEYHKNS